jgi:ADP-ribose pyrophosphatase YjhB (NUDIX family)
MILIDPLAAQRRVYQRRSNANAVPRAADNSKATMPTPITPLVGADVFVPDERGRVLLIRRADNGMWALPGGFHDLHETPATCAVRECLEETGLSIRIVRLLGVFSSNRYAEVNYPHKGGKYVHILFLGERTAGAPKITSEAREIGFFGADEIPSLSDDHAPRIELGFRSLSDHSMLSYFE